MARIDGLRKFLRRYLHWVQNSVFEGEVTRAEYRRIKERIDDFVEGDDSVLIYKARDRRWLNRDVVGVQKAESSVFI